MTPHELDAWNASLDRRDAAPAFGPPLDILEPIPAPAGFTHRTAAAVLRDRRIRRARRFAFVGTGLSAAAAAVFVVFAARPVPEPEPRVMPLRPALADAGDAIVSLTRKTTDDTLSPARNLISATKSPIERTPAPTTSAIADLPKAASNGLQPFTRTARRAVDLFVRDVGGAAGVPKSNS